MRNFIPLAQLNGPSPNLTPTPAASNKMICMFCQAEFRSDVEYASHLDNLHPGWAMLLLQKMGMKIARENG
jgi:hypothetical protein